MNYKDMNPDIDMDELYRTHQGKERVVVDLLNHFKNTLSLFPYPVREDTVKAYISKALALGLRYKAIQRAIELLPDNFEKFPSYIQFIDTVKSQSRFAKKSVVDTRETFMADIQKDIDELIAFTSKERVLMFAKAYLKNVFNITSVDASLEGCSIALCVHDWKKCGKPSRTWIFFGNMGSRLLRRLTT
jgi:hypothetical protein